jgi:hypothetical protein
MFGDDYEPPGSVDEDAKIQLLIVGGIILGVVVLVGGCITCGGVLFMLDRFVA